MIGGSIPKAVHRSHVVTSANSEKKLEQLKQSEYPAAETNNENHNHINLRRYNF